MSEAAKLTPYSAEYLSLLARKGKLASKKVDNTWYTTKSVLEDYMQKQMMRAQMLGGSYRPPEAPRAESVSDAPAPSDIPSLPRIETTMSLKHMRSLKDDIREHMKREGIPLPKEGADASHPALDGFKSPGDAAYAERTLSQEFLPHIDKPIAEAPAHAALPDIASAVHEKTTKDVESALERVLDRKLGTGPLLKKVRIFPHASFRTVSGSKILIAVSVLTIVILTISPVPYVFSAFENTLGAVKGFVSDANTVMGFRPGTHANQILLLDQGGNVAIMGHIETGSQLMSRVADGTAPIVVDSKTLVNNLNAEYVGGASSTDFTLAYVTKNGSVTSENVTLGGDVAVGKTLLVRGAEKLLGELSVGSDLAVFGDAEFRQAMKVIGPATFSGIVTLEDNLSVKKNISIRGSIEVGNAVNALSGAFSALGVTGNLSASGDVLLGSADRIMTFGAKNITLDKAGNLGVFGTATIANSSTINATTTNFFADSAAFNSISGTNLTLTHFNFGLATGTSATTTNLFSTTAVFGSLSAGSLSVNNGNLTVGSQLTLVQSQNGLTQFSARRATDSAPSGDFITYTNAAGNTPLFRVDNSGNIFAGGITNSGAFTVTSASQPQFRVQFDSSNEMTTSVNASGVTTLAANGTTPRLVWMPATDRTDTFQFANHLGVSILNIDTTNSRVGVGTTTPWAPLSVSTISQQSELLPLFAVGSTTGASHFVVLGSGNVGLGKANPGAQLDIQTNTSPNTIRVLNANGDERFSLVGGANTPVLKLTQSTGNSITMDGSGEILTNSAAVPLLLQPSVGSVGIGTSTPFARLAVNPIAGDANQFVVGSSTKTSFIITPSGNVGIGKANPSVALDVAGLLNIQYGATTNDTITISSTGSLIQQNNSSGSKYRLVADNGSGDPSIRLSSDGYFGFNSTTNMNGGGPDIGIARSAAGVLSVVNVTGSHIGTLGTIVTGSLGVGTTTPFAKFAIHANNGETNSRLFEIASSTSNSTTTLFTVLSSGNVGIGTANPQAPLHILSAGTGSASAGFIVQRSDSTTNAAHLQNYFNGLSYLSQNMFRNTDGTWSLGDTASAGVGMVLSSNSSLETPNINFLALSIANNGTQNINKIMTLLNTGNVGIGTTNPGVELEVAHNQTGNTGIQVTNTTLNQGAAAISFSGMQGNSFIFGIQNSASAIANSASKDFIFRSDGGNFVFTNGSSPLVSILKTSGNVGIGITNPGQPLQVVAASNQRGIGIMTHSPTVAGAATLDFYTQANSALGSQIIGNNAGTGELDFWVNGGNTQALTILSGGNVGIGTTTPQARLNVQASGAGTSPFLVTNSSGLNVGALHVNSNNTGSLWVSDASGNVLANVSAFSAGGQMALGSTGTFVWDSTATDATGSADSGLSRLSAGKIAVGNGTQGDVSGTLITSNIGVGTTTPTAKLFITGIGTGNGVSLETANSSNVPILKVLDNGITTLTDGATTGFGFDTTNKAFTLGQGNQVGTFSIAGADSGGTVPINITVKAGNYTGGASVPAAKLSLLGGSNTGAAPLFGGDVIINAGQGGAGYGNVQLAPLGGNVGIGTTNPQAKFEVMATTSGSTILQEVLRVSRTGGTNNDANAGRAAVLSFYDENNPTLTGAVSGLRELPGSNFDGDLAFYTNSGGNHTTVAGLTERMRISAAGNVGIGTTAPGTVNGTALTGKFFHLSSGSGAAQLVVDGTLRGALILNASSATANSRVFQLRSDTGLFQLVSWNDNETEKNVILNATSAGNVGIGTTAPTSRLNVIAASGVAESARFMTNDYNAGTNTGSGFVIDYGAASGNTYTRLTAVSSGQSAFNNLILQSGGGSVGIGTTAPSAKLQVAQAAGTSVEGLRLQSNTNSAEGNSVRLAFSSQVALDGVQRVNAAIDALTTSVASSHYGQLAFSTMNATVLSEKMRIDPVGNVGIGTTNPLDTLNVARDRANNGSDSLAQLVVSGSSATNDRLLLGYNTTADNGFIQSVHANSGVTSLLLQPGGGNVGIGITNPSYKLQVNANQASGYAGEFDNLGNSVNNWGIDITAGTNDNSGTNRMIDFRRGDGTIVGSVTASGGVTAYNTTSDKRLKIDNGVAMSTSVLQNLVIHDFTWRGSGALDRGVFAQEAYLVKPSAVVVGSDAMDANGNLISPWEVDYSKFVPDLIVGWQQHESVINGLHVDLASAASSIADLQAFASSTSARLDALELRVGALENSTSTGLTLDATTTQSIVGSVLATLGATIANGLTHFGDIVVSALTIGSHEKPVGVTFYDTVTGDPYCLKVANGVQVTIAGVCGNTDTSQSSSNGTMTNDQTGTSTPSEATSTPPVDSSASSTPPTTSDASSTPPTDSGTTTPPVTP
ncbi:MAG: hypothetical protein JWN50_339 [Parcubacteria group bacterium]|nr:hypothetical protein [Parcubacteria group bacterium]